MARLVGFICPEHGYVNVENTGGICPKCKRTVHGDKVLPKHFFDITSGKEIAYSDVDKVCKEKGFVFGGDEEITKECQRNRSYQETMFQQRLERELYPSIMEKL